MTIENVFFYLIFTLTHLVFGFLIFAEWADTYGIHHRRIFWSRCRKLSCVGSEPTTTEFRSDALTDWAIIRPWVRLALRANFVQLLQFHRLFSVAFNFDYRLCQSPRLFELKVSWDNHMSAAEWADSLRNTEWATTPHLITLTLFIYWMHSLTHTLTCLLTRSFTDSLAHTLACSLTHSFHFAGDENCYKQKFSHGKVKLHFRSL